MENIYKPNYGYLLFFENLKSLREANSSFENTVMNDIVRTILSYFSNFNLSKDGQSFCIDGSEYSLKYTFNEIERKYIVGILNNDVSKKYNAVSLNSDINEFGKIRQFEILFPKVLAKHVSLLSKVIVDQIKYAYLTFEKAFRNKFIEYEELLIRNLYSTIEIELTRRNLNQLQKNFWITLTKLSKQEKDLFLFFFDSKTIDTTIQIFKQNQTNLYSTFEILESLLFEEVIDSGMEFFNQNIKEVTIEFGKNVNYGKKNSKYLNSQKILFNDKAFGFTYICNTQDLLLAINYPKKYSAHFKKFLAEINDTIIYIFNENLNKNPFKFNSTKKVNPSLTKIYNESKDLLATVLAKAIKEIYSPM